MNTEIKFDNGNYLTFNDFRQSQINNNLTPKWNFDPVTPCQDKNCAPPPSTGINKDLIFHTEIIENKWRNTDTGF